MKRLIRKIRNSETVVFLIQMVALTTIGLLLVYFLEK